MNSLFRSTGNVTLAFNNQLSRGRTANTAYDVHLQPAGALVPVPMAASYPSPATKQIVVQPQAGAGGQLQPPPQGFQPPQQYVPVTMVEQNGRQIMAAVQAATWPTRQQLALAVPSWQQLTTAGTFDQLFLQLQKEVE